MNSGPDSLTPYLKRLFILLVVATMFEGFDTLVTGFALPYIAQDFHVDVATIGTGVGIIAIGPVLAFIPIRLADFFGRRPVLLLAILLYTIFTLMTAFAVTFWQFVGFQLVARLFMVTEISLAYIILSEEMPAHFRGRANATILAVSFGVAGTFAAIVFRHTIDTVLGWRSMYLFGAILLLFFPLYWRHIRETLRWQSNQPQIKSSFSLISEFRRTTEIFSRRLLGSTLVAGTLWFLTNLWTGTALFWFNFYAIRERAWTPEFIGIVVPIASILACFGHLLGGVMMDVVGRRITGLTYFLVGGAATVIGFTTDYNPLIVFCYIIVMMTQGVWAVIATITTELYPTALRATGYAVANNLIGRSGMIMSGVAVGFLSSTWLGSVGNAVAALGVLNLLSALIIWQFVPEFRGKKLEEIHELRAG